jgi:hypothetical protein
MQVGSAWALGSMKWMTYTMRSLCVTGLNFPWSRQ